MDVKLADFIRANIELLLQEWEDFAKSIPHAKGMAKIELRNHARQILLVIADNLGSHQSKSEQAARSKGFGRGLGEESWAKVHGFKRCASGFSVMETISEFRALRASVLSHWTEDRRNISDQQLAELIKFDEAIDRAITTSLEQYASIKETEGRMFNAILVASPDPIDLLDLQGRFIYVNQATADLFALAPEAIIGKSTIDLGFPFAPDFQRNLEKVISDQSSYRGRFSHTFASGRGERFEYLLAPVPDKNGNTEAVVGIFHDVTERALAEEQVWYEAHHDLLTGLPNRRLFLDRLEQEVKHAKRRTASLAVVFVDLDGFKEVNDSFGHDAGDRLLSAVATRLIDCVREEDTIARMGGDEFTILLTGIEQRADAELVAQAIIDALIPPFHIAKQPVRISVSIGISFYPWDASSTATLLQVADQAMYKAKRCSHHQICFLDTPEEPERYSAR